jgi:aquaporin Z
LIHFNIGEIFTMNKLLAEFIGTFTLVLFGCGAAVLAGDQVGQLGIAFAFGLAIVAMAYGIGRVSGCHINPAVSFGFFVSGRMEAREMVFYWLAQIVGAVAGASILLMIALGAPGYDLAVNGLGQNGWGADYLGGYSTSAALIFEVVATFIFVIVILGVTSDGEPAGFAGIGIGLTLVMIHIVGIQVTGVSVNPARSIGPALLVGQPALSQLWLFVVAPLFGAGVAGMLYKLNRLEP